jgi:two-component system OmpR family response regulator
MAKVMLAEDDPTMVGLLKTLLHMDGYEVVALDATEDVPAAVRHVRPDVLLLDVHLSNQNGLEILDNIRSSDGARATRVIMISGLNLREDCLKRGADDFLLKPFMPDDLIKTLKRSLKGK